MDYRLHPHFFYRAPAFAWHEIAPALHDETLLHQLLRRPDIAHALSESTADFYALFLAAARQDALTPKLLLKMRQYLVRMSTRSTPFGHFAGVGTGHISSQTQFPSTLRETKKFYPHRDHRPAASARYLLNPTLHLRGRVARIYKRKAGEHEWVRLKLGASMAGLASHLNQPRLASEACRAVRKEWGCSDKLARRYIDDLISAEILVQAVPLAGPASGILGFGATPTLRRNEGEKVLACAEVILKLFSPRPVSPFLKQLQAFLKANSLLKPFPLTALSEKFLPLVSPKLQLAESHSSLEARLTKKLAHWDPAERVWTLRGSELAAMLEETHSVAPGAPSAISALVSVVATSGDALALTLNGVVANSASLLHGRFGEVDEGIKQIIDDIHQFEAQNSAPAVTADIAFVSSNAKANYLMARATGLRHYIDVSGIDDGAKERIPVSDLAFVLDENECVRLVSLSLAQEIRPVLTHALNLRSENHYYYRVLGEFAQSQGCHFNWNWGAAQNAFAFFPRVVIGGVVVKKAYWVLDPQELSSEKSLLSYFSARGIPTQVLLAHRDQKLFIDVSLPFGEKVLQWELRKGAALILEEVLEHQLGHESELVLTGFRKAQTGPSGLLSFEAPETLVHGTRVKYLKIYADPDDFNEILTELRTARSCGPFFKDWFFIKYQDDGPHLRLRFFATPSESDALETHFGKILQRMVDQHRVWRVQWSTYEREVARYGGSQGVRFFEELSCVDSDSILAQVRLLQQRQHAVSEQLLLAGAENLTRHWLSFFFADEEEAARLLASMTKEKSTARSLPPPSGPLPDLPVFFDSAKEKLLLAKLRRKFTKLSADWSATKRNHFIGSMLHMSLNRWCFDPAVEYHAYRRVLKQQRQATATKSRL